MTIQQTDSIYLQQTRQWLEGFVIRLNLCPFAAAPFRHDQIRFVVQEGDSEPELVRTFLRELELLHRSDPSEIETTLLIHPHQLLDFLEYNEFLGLLDDLLEQAGLIGIIQIASFHPDYRFAGVPPTDPANYTNRSPYPMLHLLREASVSRAVEQFPEADRIPEVNIQRLRSMELSEILNGWKEGR